MKIKSIFLFGWLKDDAGYYQKLNPENKYAPISIDLFEDARFAIVTYPNGQIERLNLDNVVGYSYEPLDAE